MTRRYLIFSLVATALLSAAGRADAVMKKSQRTESELQAQHQRVQRALHTQKGVVFKVVARDPRTNSVQARTFEVISEAGGTVHFGDAGLVIHTTSNVAKSALIPSSDYKILLSHEDKFADDASNPKAVRDLLSNLIDSYDKKIASGLIESVPGSTTDARLRVSLWTMKELVVHLDGVLNRGTKR